MRVSTPLLALMAIGAVVALAPAAQAATPFTAGTGGGQDLAVGSDGTGHVVWLTDEAADRIGYCRVPAGGAACDSESTFLTFPPAPSASSSGDHAQVFTPAADKVVILASCTQCPGSANRTYRFISTNNGVDFSAAVEVGSIRLNGQAAYMNTDDVALSVSGRIFQGQDNPASATDLTLGVTASSVYDASAATVPASTKAVYAVNDLDTVRYRVFSDPVPGTSAADLNNVANWGGNQLLSAA
ncbi:MAG TPA: hypothetical protein VER75_00735, partial [Thermoleophilaceae bacterium]|nr:hypothetical protein [Thermoleophilaceae bacterium]